MVTFVRLVNSVVNVNVELFPVRYWPGLPRSQEAGGGENHT